jgi:hypothetical protein
MRVTGLIMIGLALLAGAFDLVQTGALRALGSWWFMLHRDSLQLLQPALERHVAVWLWDPVLLTVLQWPFVAVLAAPGLALAVLGRGRA